MFGRYALLVGVPDRSHVAAEGAAFALQYGVSVSKTASSEARTTTPVNYGPLRRNRPSYEPSFAQLGIK